MNEDVKKTPERTKERKDKIHRNIGIFISFAALIVSIFNSWQTNIVKFTEQISITEVCEDEYYFDGEKLTKEISFMVLNNSQVGISIVSCSIVRELRKADIYYTESSFELPINLPSCSSVKQRVYIEKKLDATQIDMITKEFGSNCSINTFELTAFLEAGENLYKNTTIHMQPSLKIILTTAKGTQIVFEQNGGSSARFDAE